MKKTLLLFAAGCFLFTLSQSHAMGRVPKKEYDAKVAALNDCAVRLNDTNTNLENLKQKAQQDAANAKAQIDALQTSKSQLESAKTQLESTNGQLLKDMDSSKNDLQKRLADMTREKQDIEKQKQEIEKQKQSEVDKLKNTYDDLVTDMKKEIEQGSIQITQLQNKLSVNMVDKILFNSGEADVNSEGKKVLQKVANVLKKVQNKQIRIEGHTDNVPIGGALKEKFPTNWELSTARATYVSRYLTEACGVDPALVSAAGYAHFRPIADNSTAEGKSKNRRIEITLVPLETTAATPPAPIKKEEKKTP